MTNQYIAMCDTPEIQEQWTPKEGDQYFKKWVVMPEIPNQPDYLYTPYFLLDNSQAIHKPSFVWSPRIEDYIRLLMETGKWGTEFDLEGAFHTWTWRYGSPRWLIIDLWLAFYMSTHNLQWSGEGWE